jgi:hypothetical protein
MTTIIDKDIDDDDDDDDDEYNDDDVNDETTTEGVEGAERRRNEVVEVRKMSSKDSQRIHVWRLVVTCVLLLTAFAVTFTTFTLLQKQEEKNFTTAVRFLNIPFISNRLFETAVLFKLMEHCII